MSYPPNSPRQHPTSEIGTWVERVADGARSFWDRVTEGLEIEQLWSQFHADALASYQVYAKEVDWEHVNREPSWKRALRIARALFWAMLIKLTPPRRVLLLISLVFLVFPRIEVRFGQSGSFQFEFGGFHLLGVLGLLVLLTLELADRVVMKRDLEIAREIQQWLVPAAPPQVPGIDIAFATRPANTVAGDYYDAFLRPSTDGATAGTATVASGPANRLLIVVGDVAGKSVPAALLMATFQASLRTLAAAPSSLVDLVGGLNGYVSAHSRGGLRFTTAFLAELDPASGALTSVNAGHNAPVLRRSSGELERLQTGGLPFGIKSEARYESARTMLQPGDVLVIFTDGVVEAENLKGDEYGEARLLELLKELRVGGAQQVLGALMDSVDAFVGKARQHDDITCLVMWMV